jgi:hypothetical protein
MEFAEFGWRGSRIVSQRCRIASARRGAPDAVCMAISRSPLTSSVPLRTTLDIYRRWTMNRRPGRIAPALAGALLLLSGLLLWTAPATACLALPGPAAATDVTAMSRPYWIASLLVGAALMGFDAYQKRFSIILGLTVILLAFHPHLTAYPDPCALTSVLESQIVLGALVVMLGYRIVRTATQTRRKPH